MTYDRYKRLAQELDSIARKVLDPRTDPFGGSNMDWYLCALKAKEAAIAFSMLLQHLSNIEEDDGK